MKKITDYIKEHPALKVSELSKATGFSQSLLYGIISGEKSLSIENAFDLAKILSHYGLRLDGWIFKPYDYKEDLNTLYAYKFKDEPPETIDKGGHFEYKHVLFKETFDVFDFKRVFND